MNFTWDNKVAAKITGGPSSTGGRGLSGMASNGTEVMVFGAVHNSTKTFAAYTELYNESNNSWWPAHGMMPPPLANFSLSSDPGYAGGTAILFGGEDLSSGTPGEPSNATWVFNFGTSSWIQVTPSVGPSGRVDAAFATNPSGGNGLLIGGWNDTTGVEDDMWELNVSDTPMTWQYLGAAPTIVPSALGVFGASLVATGPNRFLLADGCTNNPSTTCTNRTAVLTVLNQNGTSVSTAFSDTLGPEARAYATLVWDPAQSVAILYGGEVPLGSSPEFLNDTWVYHPSANQWVLQGGSSPPTPRALAPAVWLNDSQNETLLLNAGIMTTLGVNLVWRFSPVTQLSITVNESGGAPAVGANVTVTVYKTVWSLTTNSTGVAAGPVGPGQTTVVVSLRDFYNATLRFTSSPASPTNVSAELLPLPVLEVRTWHLVSGTPVPLPDVKLYRNGTSNEVGVSNASGMWNSSVDHGGTISLSGVTTGYGWATNSTDIPYLGFAFLNLTLAPAPPANLSVHVNSSLGGSLSGVWVNATNYTHANTSTDTAGWANQTDLSPGNLNATIHAWKPAYYVNLDADVFLPSSATTVVYLTMTPLPILTVRTWADDNGKVLPLAGVKLASNWSAPQDGLGVSNASGWLNRSMSGPGAILVNGTLLGYSDATNSTVLPFTGHAFVNLTLKAEFVEAFLHVNDSSSHTPVEGALVVLTDPGGSSSNFTNAGGYANFTTLLPGNDSVDVSRSGYYANDTTHEVPGGRTFWLNLSLVPWPSLHVHSLGAGFDGSSVSELVGADVSRNLTYLGATIGNGWLNLSQQAPGAANISASHAGFHPNHEDVVLNHTGTLNVTLVLSPITGVLDVHVDASVGRVNEPLDLAQANLSSPQGLPSTSNLTDGLGWVNFTLLQGNYSVVVWAYGYLPSNSQGPVFVGQQTLNFTLTRIPGANVSVLVLNKNTSQPVNNATVIFSVDGIDQGNSTGPAGWTNVTDLWPAADWQVYATADGYFPNLTSIRLNFREIIPEFLIYLRPVGGKSTTKSNTTAPFSLVTPSEQTLWWPFLTVPIVFFVGAVVVVAYQGSRRRRGS